MPSYFNAAESTLASGITSGATTLSVDTGDGDEFPAVPASSGCLFFAHIWNKTDYSNPADDPDFEIIKVTARTAASDSFATIVRGQLGTSAAAHNTGGKTYGIGYGPYSIPGKVRFEISRVKLPASNSPFLDRSGAWDYVVFDDSADQDGFWPFDVPPDYGCNPELRLRWTSDVTSGNIQWEIQFRMVDDSTAEDIESMAWDTVTQGASNAVPGTAGYPDTEVIDLTEANLAAAGPNAAAQLRIIRNTGVASNAAGNAKLFMAQFEYTKAG